MKTFPSLDRSPGVPGQVLPKQIDLLSRSFEVEAARLDQNDVRVELAKSFDGDGRGMLTGIVTSARPPARSTSSGIHVPPIITGSSHSIVRTVGRSEAAAARRAMSPHRRMRSVTTSSAWIDRPRARPTRRTSSHTSARTKRASG